MRQRVLGLAPREFRKEWLRVSQKPKEARIATFTLEKEGVTVMLQIWVYLIYLGASDPGTDRFKLELEFRRKARWQGREAPEILSIKREFSDLTSIKKWLLSLNDPICVMLYHDVTSHYEINCDRIVLRLLLSLNDCIKALDNPLQTDMKRRKDLLAS